jgi:hypothetical protein
LRGSTPADIEKLADRGHKGYIYPVDEALGVSGLPYHITLGAMLKIAKEACLADSYEASQGRLKELGIDVNDDTIRAVTNTIGQLVLDHETQKADEAFSVFNSGKWTFPEEKIPHVLYLEADGSMAHIRKDKDEESQEKNLPINELCENGNEDCVSILKQSGKKSHWREVKLGIAFSSDHFLNWTDKHGVRQHKIQKKDFVSYIGEASEFNKRMLSLALRNGYGSYQEVVIISDGATWIREMKKMYFPDAQQILDFYHLRENISTFAKNVFSLDESKYKPWADKACDLMKKSQANSVLTMIKSLTKSQLAKSTHDLGKYIQNNIDNVDYKKYLSKGYFIGSGAIESSNRTVVQSRVKLAGMRWSLSPIQNVLALMTKLQSQKWEQDVVNVVYQHYNQAQSRYLFQKSGVKGQ